MGKNFLGLKRKLPISTATKIISGKIRFIFFLVFLISILLLLAGCTKKECKTNEQCIKEGHEGKCTAEWKCAYEKLCGTKICKGKEGTLLEKKCVNENTCISTIPANNIKLASQTTEQTMAGDKFKITTNYNQPFNTRKDKLNLKLTLSQQAQANSEEKITHVELIGKTKDQRTLTLAEKDTTRVLWTDGSETTIPLTIDFPTADTEGEFTSLTLKIYYNYVQTSGSQKQTKEATLQQNYPAKFSWARPSQPYPCPTKCPEETTAMKGECSPETGICEYTPVPNTCGNYICEANENKCSCKQDCGPCEATTGVYTTRMCTTDNRCVGTIKSGVTPTPKTIIDDKELGYMHLMNNYKYNNPFNTKTDKFTIEMQLYELPAQTTGVKIETIRILEGAQQIAELQINEDLPQTGSKITKEITIPQQPAPEAEKNIKITVWYQYTQNGAIQKGTFEKQLDKTVLISPE